MNGDFIKIIRDSLEHDPLNGEFKWKKTLHWKTAEIHQ